MILFQQYTKPGIWVPTESYKYSFSIGIEGYFPGQYFKGTDTFLRDLK